MRFSKALPMLEIFNLGCLIAPSSSSNSPLPFGRSSIGAFGTSRKATGPSRTVPCVALTNEAIDVCRPAPTRYIAVPDLVDGRSGSSACPGLVFLYLRGCSQVPRKPPMVPGQGTTRRKSPKGDKVPLGENRQKGTRYRDKVPLGENRQKGNKVPVPLGGNGGDGATNLGKYYWHLC